MSTKTDKALPLIISGAQGRGKNLIAREIAKQCGAFIEIDGEVFLDRFALGYNIYAALKIPNTIILQANLSPAICKKISAIYSNPDMIIHTKAGQDFIIATPNIIIVLDYEEPDITLIEQGAQILDMNWLKHEKN